MNLFFSITMGTMTLAMLFVYSPTVLRKRFGAIDLHSKTQNRNWFRFFKIDYGLSYLKMYERSGF